MKKFSQLISCYECAENYPDHYSEHDHIHGHELDLSSMCSECHSMVGHHTVVEMVSHQKICDECNLRYRLNFHHNPFKFNCTSKSDTVNWWQISRLQNAIACNVNAIVVVLTIHLTVTLLAVLEAFNNFFYCHTMDDFLTRLSHVRQPSARFARNAGALSTLRVTPQGTGD